MKKAFYITTPIYYPSAKLHIGHAYCTTLCDILARYHRLKKEDTFFLTGSDEHGMKIEKNALANNKTPKEFVDEIVVSFKQLWKALDISNDDYIRTTDERHVKTVQKIFSKFLENGDIYLGEYEGWYCKECEAFWTDIQVGEDHLCPDCHRPVNKAKEEAYFFKTSKYLNRLLKLYEDNPKFIIPESRKNEMINTFIKPGLEDLCVSRTSFTWGIPVKENPKHVIYVWLDALVNYISALGYLQEDDSKFKKFWLNEDCEKVHILGADITRFHSIYWPMFLMALDLPFPDREFVHGLLMTKDGKMSKSKGNTIDPYPLIERYGVDCVRYYLAREINFGSDGQFTPEQFVERINMDLANNIGNLLNRTLSMINKYFDGIIPEFVTNINNPYDSDLDDTIKSCIALYQSCLDDLRVTDGIIAATKISARANKYIDETTPWVLAKQEDKQPLKSVISHLAYSIYVTAILLSVVLTRKSKDILLQLGLDGSVDFDTINNQHILDNVKINKGEPIFPRLDEAKEVEEIVNMMKK